MNSQDKTDLKDTLNDLGAATVLGAAVLAFGQSAAPADGSAIAAYVLVGAAALTWVLRTRIAFRSSSRLLGGAAGTTGKAIVSFCFWLACLGLGAGMAVQAWSEDAARIAVTTGMAALPVTVIALGIAFVGGRARRAAADTGV